jgi:hypothetical protein
MSESDGKLHLVPEIDIEEGTGTGEELPPLVVPDKIRVLRDLNEESLYDPVFIQAIGHDVHFYLFELQRLVPKDKRFQLIAAALLQPEQDEAMAWVRAIKRVKLLHDPNPGLDESDEPDPDP